MAGHKQTSTTELVYRRELRPVITTGAELMDKVFSHQSERAIPLPVSEAASSAGSGPGRLLASADADGAVRLWNPRRPRTPDIGQKIMQGRGGV